VHNERGQGKENLMKKGFYIKIIKFTEKRSIKKNVCRNIPEPIRPLVMATLS
jgi:hypothetical protein